MDRLALLIGLLLLELSACGNEPEWRMVEVTITQEGVCLLEGGPHACRQVGSAIASKFGSTRVEVLIHSLPSSSHEPITELATGLQAAKIAAFKFAKPASLPASAPAKSG